MENKENFKYIIVIIIALVIFVIGIVLPISQPIIIITSIIGFVIYTVIKRQQNSNKLLLTNQELNRLLPLANQGDINAKYDLAEVYFKTRNYIKAIEWFISAANQGHKEAQCAVGQMYRDGLGVPQDYVRAYVYFAIAAVNGNKTAEILQNVLRKNMTSAQIEESEVKTKEFIKNTNNLSNRLVNSDGSNNPVEPQELLEWLKKNGGQIISVQPPSEERMNELLENMNNELEQIEKEEKSNS